MDEREPDKVCKWAYGVAANFPPHKGGAVPESEKRRAAWCTNSTSHTCLSRSFPRAVPSTHLLPTHEPRRGAGGGARVRDAVRWCQMSEHFEAFCLGCE